MTTGPDYEAAMQDFKRGGWITALFGGAGMLARLLITDEAHPAIWWTRRILASVIIGVLSYFAVWPLELAGIYKSVILTFSGMAGPELIDWVIRQFRNAPDLNAKKRQTKAKRR
jgi:hypothetical protein